MIIVLLREQVRRMGLILLLLVVVAAAVPVASTVLFTSEMVTGALLVQYLLEFSPVYSVVAALTGITLGVGTWYGDQEANHTYALVLPVPRWHYVLLRFAASALLLVPMFVGFAISCLIATRSVVLPPELHAYPLALTTRFVFGTLAVFAVFFAISAGTARTAGRILFVLVILAIADVFVSASFDASFFDWFFRVWLGGMSPLQILLGRWMLFDV